MVQRVLITGGAGFIGSHLADELLAQRYQVRVLDDLCAQVHGESRARPAYLDPEVELQVGDLRDPEAVREALREVDAVVHLASRVGVGQSMYQVRDYVGVNDLGTAVLLEALVDRPVERLVVASSMSIYGEGLYRTGAGALVGDAKRDPKRLGLGRFEPEDEHGQPLVPTPTPESKTPSLVSVYALSKYVQERLCLMIGQSYGVPTVALRFFNVFGPRQALSNPYTGVLAIFASRLLNGHRPTIFEDGEQRRDFVSVYDVARACRLALERPEAAGLALNVGSGLGRSVREVATVLARLLGRDDLEPEITGRVRHGDIRHCFADPALAEARLGFRAEVSFDEGLRDLIGWLDGRSADDQVDRATEELLNRGLVS
ncbi:MAG: NAD-dependent epimerase/dehydratase family protein [Geminicoccaceae bacterium]|nr:NAD-dependent epimerase/dehydratase family protein [Geminicoccaceae bacterium]